MAPRTRTGSARQGSDDGRRAQLLELGLRLFGGRSYAEISIDDIATAARISRGLLYHYFDGKRGFYLETVRHAAARLVERVKTDPDLEPEARLRAGISAYLEYVETFAEAYVVLMRGGLGVDEKVREVLDGARESIVDHLIDGGPELRRTPAVHAALRGWLHLVEGMSLDWLEHGEIPREMLVDILASALWAIADTAVGPAPDDALMRD